MFSFTHAYQKECKKVLATSLGSFYFYDLKFFAMQGSFANCFNLAAGDCKTIVLHVYVLMRLPFHVRLHSYTKIRRRAQWFRNGGSGAIKNITVSSFHK